MYGIVEVKGHQYRVSEGDIIDTQKMEGEVGTKVELDKVLFVSGDSPKIGTPVVEGAVITVRSKSGRAVWWAGLFTFYSVEIYERFIDWPSFLEE